MKPEIILMLNNIPVEKIKFTAVPIGTVRELALSVQNTGDIMIDELEFESDHDDVKVVIAPTELNVNQKSVLVIQYKPEKQIDEGLNTALKIRGKYVI